MRRWIIALVTVLILPSCATSPTGRTQFMLVPPEMAIAESRLAYVQTVQELTQSGEMLSDPALTNRVSLITGRLVAAAVRTWPHTSGWEWSVALIDDPEMVNAWCMAGGRMAVYSGLVSKLDLSDDEFAHVMGHEISHAIANHSAEQMSFAILQGLAVTAIAYETEDRTTTAVADMLATVALALPNSRTAEYEADELGMGLVIAAGYDPDAAVSLWNKMLATEGSSGSLEFLSTHPNPDNRSARLAALANQQRAQSPSVPPDPYPVRIYPRDQQ